MLQIVASLTEDSRGVICDRNILIIQAKKVEVTNTNRISYDCKKLYDTSPRCPIW